MIPLIGSDPLHIARLVVIDDNAGEAFRDVENIPGERRQLIIRLTPGIAQNFPGYALQLFFHPLRGKTVHLLQTGNRGPFRVKFHTEAVGFSPNGYDDDVFFFNVRVLKQVRLGFQAGGNLIPDWIKPPGVKGIVGSDDCLFPPVNPEGNKFLPGWINDQIRNRFLMFLMGIPSG